MSVSNAPIIGVVGAGTMGRGVAQLFAEGGHAVRLFDAVPGAAARGRQFVADLMQRAVDKGRHTKDQASAVLDRITLCDTLTDLTQCSVVIEAIVEDIAVKQQLFDALEAVVAAGATTADQVSRACGAGSDCGACRFMVTEIVENARGAACPAGARA